MEILYVSIRKFSWESNFILKRTREATLEATLRIATPTRKPTRPSGPHPGEILPRCLAARETRSRCLAACDNPFQHCHGHCPLKSACGARFRSDCLVYQPLSSFVASLPGRRYPKQHVLVQGAPPFEPYLMPWLYSAHSAVLH